MFDLDWNQKQFTSISSFVSCKVVFILSHISIASFFFVTISIRYCIWILQTQLTTKEITFGNTEIDEEWRRRRRSWILVSFRSFYFLNEWSEFIVAKIVLKSYGIVSNVYERRKVFTVFIRRLQKFTAHRIKESNQGSIIEFTFTHKQQRLHDTLTLSLSWNNQSYRTTRKKCWNFPTHFVSP